MTLRNCFRNKSVYPLAGELLGGSSPVRVNSSESYSGNHILIIPFVGLGGKSSYSVVKRKGILFDIEFLGNDFSLNEAESYAISIGKGLGFPVFSLSYTLSSLGFRDNVFSSIGDFYANVLYNPFN